MNDSAASLTLDALPEAPAAPRVGAAGYDLLMRVPAVLFFGLSSYANGTALVEEFNSVQAFDGATVLRLLAHVAGLAFVLTVMLAMAVRSPPVARRGGLLPRVAALAGAFSLVVLLSCPKADMPPFLAGLSFALIIIGNGMALHALLHLGRALSIMAEARHLVTSGPYRLARHPLYAAEAVVSFGLLLQFQPLPAVIVWLAHIALQFYRMHYEEQVLCRAFPDYVPYAARTARIVPGVF